MSGGESQSQFSEAAINPATTTASASVPRASHLRQFLESLLCLAIAVIVFRTFQVEGYMISTGSMAPALLGFHKQVVCPTCKFSFAFGVSYQSESSRAITGDGEEPANSDFNGYDTGDRQLCTCPNCGQSAIEISQVPRNQGDQLLVFREAYWLRPPRRWEVIVFRNPYDTTQAYVKRLAGLPGETIEIRDGDVYADGIICRKSYDEQKAVRISVYDHNYEPSDDPAWQSRWQADEPWEREGQAFLTAGNMPVPTPPPVTEPNSAVHGLSLTTDTNPWSWVTYGHALRSGGKHLTAVVLPKLEEELNWPPDMLPAKYDVKTRQLSIIGVMPVQLWERLHGVAKDPKYREALDQLYHRSHLSPVTDDYGYNRVTYQSSANAVRDVMLSLNLELTGPSAQAVSERQFAIDMTDGENTFRLLLDFSRREVQLLSNPELTPNAPPLRTGALSPKWLAQPCRLEMSLMDRQVTVAINGEEPFEAWPIADPMPTRDSPRFPVRFGARGLAGRAFDLQLFRDVYYTTKGDEKPFSLKHDELYVLGDNSPVSLDSRRWKNGAVPMRLLLGKPFVVHLPSRQMKVRIGDTVRHIRIPDFPKVRYIR